jgi:transcriptional regulator of acetoin/glycerol metabolism
MIDWQPTAARLGYSSEESMWQELYDGQKLSIAQLSARLGVSRNTVRLALERRGVHIRKRGGANNKSLTLSPEILDDIRQHGILTVAKKLKLNYTTLYKRLRKAGLSVADLRGSKEKADAGI